MSLEWKAYVSDPRTICKYGSKCYQKNPDHHKAYKHPPHSKNNTEHKARNRRWSPYQRDADHRKHRDERLDHDPENTDTSSKTENKRFNEISSHDKDEIETAIEQNDQSTQQRDSSEASTSTVEIAPSKKENTTAVIKLPETITYYGKDDTNILKELFLVEMPPDFFQFYKCLSENDGFEKMLAGVNLELIGPYDLLLGRLPILDEKELYLIHWRFFYDPPEFQAVLKKKGKSQFHMGYFRDEPDRAPVFVASNDSEKGYHITPMAENIFAAVYLYLQNEKKSSPFTSMACQKLMDKVKKWAEAHNYSVEEFNMKKRLGQMVTKTFHGAGIVVPYNKKTQLGYRRLVETDVNLRKLFNKLESAKTEAERDSILSEIQPVITYANIAVDECDFGTGLEIGIDLFCSGLKELQSDTVSCLSAAYSVLNRNAFSKIIQVHIKYRRKGPNMSVLSVSDRHDR